MDVKNPVIAVIGAGAVGGAAVAAVSGDPHSAQNFFSAGLDWPQAGQTTRKRAPHSLQNLPSAAISARHAGHFASAGIGWAIRRRGVRAHHDVPLPKTFSPAAHPRLQRVEGRSALDPARVDPVLDQLLPSSDVPLLKSRGHSAHEDLLANLGSLSNLAPF